MSSFEAHQEVHDIMKDMGKSSSRKIISPKNHSLDGDYTNLNNKSRTIREVIESIKKHRRVISNIDYRKLIDNGKKV
jgi:hypothetical protein